MILRLAFVNIVDVEIQILIVCLSVLITAGTREVNICRSYQLSLRASAKKFHPTASIESTIQATSYNMVLFETTEHIFTND